METKEMAMNSPQRPGTPGRVVEAEISLPKLDELELPKIDLEPMRAMAEKVLITGIGVSVLVARAVKSALETASQVGEETAQAPGPLTRSLLHMVGRKLEDQGAPSSGIRVKVPVLPIDNYERATEQEIVEQLPDLTPDQLRVLGEYEAIHEARTTILDAIDDQLSAD